MDAAAPSKLLRSAEYPGHGPSAILAWLSPVGIVTLPIKYIKYLAEQSAEAVRLHARQEFQPSGSDPFPGTEKGEICIEERNSFQKERRRDNFVVPAKLLPAKFRFSKMLPAFSINKEKKKKSKQNPISPVFLQWAAQTPATSTPAEAAWHCWAN